MRYLRNILITLTLIALGSCNYEFTIAPWENGIIPYYLSGEFTDGDINTLESAMRRWEAVCGVRFEKVTPRASAYEIVHDTRAGWFSTIGENNSRCYMHFNGRAPEIDAITHELGHCLGLVHEHQRPDRDDYVNIVWNKIIDGKEFNFDILDNPLLIEQGFEYDYNSIMHYPPVSFSKDGEPTIIAINGEEIVSDGISITDALRGRRIYGPPLEDDDYE